MEGKKQGFGAKAFKAHIGKIKEELCVGNVPNGCGIFIDGVVYQCASCDLHRVGVAVIVGFESHTHQSELLLYKFS